MSYPKKDNPTKKTFLYRWYPNVAEALVKLRPGEIRTFFCENEKEARRLRWHILAFCRAFYGFLPYRTAVSKNRDSSEWVIDVDAPAVNTVREKEKE